MSAMNSAGCRQRCRLRRILDSKTLLCLIPHRGIQAFYFGISHTHAGSASEPIYTLPIDFTLEHTPYIKSGKMSALDFRPYIF